MSEQRLDDSDIGTAFEQMGRKAVAQRVQAHPFPDPGPIGRLVEQPVELAGAHRRAGLATRKQPAFLQRRCVYIKTPTRLPPLSQQINHLRRQHDVAILAALGLLDPNDLLRAVDMLDLQPDDFAGAQSAAIAETEQHADLEAACDGQQAPGLVLAHHQRDLLRLTDVIDLGGKLQSPQRDAEQEPQPGHDAVTVADARARLRQMQLEPADILRRSRLGRSLQKCSELLAAANVASLRARTELARVHVLDHALAQRRDGFRTHRQTPVLDEVEDTSILKTGRPARYRRSLLSYRATDSLPPQRAIAQRFSALAHSCRYPAQ